LETFDDSAVIDMIIQIKKKCCHGQMAFIYSYWEGFRGINQASWNSDKKQRGDELIKLGFFAHSLLSFFLIFFTDIQHSVLN